MLVRYQVTPISTQVTTVCKQGAGVLHTITINKPVASSVITIYDAIEAKGTPIATITLPGALLTQGPYSALYDAPFTNGLTIVTSGAASDITVVWL